MNWKGLLIGLTLAPKIVSAQVALNWQIIDAGGGTTTGDSYALVSTIGQPSAGTLNGGTYSLAGGFWGGIAPQAPAVPLLSLNQTTTNTIVLSWPVSSVNYLLQENTTLSVAGDWPIVAQLRTTNNGRILILLPLLPESRFYRLKSQ